MAVKPLQPAYFYTAKVVDLELLEKLLSDYLDNDLSHYERIVAGNLYTDIRNVLHENLE